MRCQKRKYPYFTNDLNKALFTYTYSILFAQLKKCMKVNQAKFKNFRGAFERKSPEGIPNGLRLGLFGISYCIGQVWVNQLHLGFPPWSDFPSIDSKMHESKLVKNLKASANHCQQQSGMEMTKEETFQQQKSNFQLGFYFQIKKPCRCACKFMSHLRPQIFNQSLTQFQFFC